MRKMRRLKCGQGHELNKTVYLSVCLLCIYKGHLLFFLLPYMSVFYVLKVIWCYVLNKLMAEYLPNCLDVFILVLSVRGSVVIASVKLAFDVL